MSYALKMRNFTHPTTDSLQLTHVLAALGDPLRLALVKQLVSCPHHTPMNCAKVAEKLENLPLSTRHYHLSILREAGLIRSERKGVEVLNTLRFEDIEQRFPGLLKSILLQQE